MHREKKEKRTTTIADLEILHPNPTLPKNQNKASFLSFFFYSIKNTNGERFFFFFSLANQKHSRYTENHVKTEPISFLKIFLTKVEVMIPATVILCSPAS
jgi:hypothetical protein